MASPMDTEEDGLKKDRSTLPPLEFGRISKTKIDQNRDQGGDCIWSAIETSPHLELIRSQQAGRLKFSPEMVFDFTSKDLQDMGEIGQGAFGTVSKMLHTKTNTLMAVKGDCWICMELMDTSLEKLYKIVYDKLHEVMPEEIIGKVTVAPERLSLSTRGYDVRSDIWSLGITLVEVATGRFPYPEWNSVFEQLQQVVNGDPPMLAPSDRFSADFVLFVNTCLIKEEAHRPKYNKLLEHKFVRRFDAAAVDVAGYVSRVLDTAGSPSPPQVWPPLAH